MRITAILLITAIASANIAVTTAYARGGVYVAAGDINGDGKAAAGPQVKVFNGNDGVLNIGSRSFQLSGYSFEVKTEGKNGPRAASLGRGQGCGKVSFLTAEDAQDAAALLVRGADASLETQDGTVIVFTGLEVAPSSSGSPMPTEQVAFNFTKITH
ncbi:MAG: hypothetical protein R3C58_03655 [Parvularculaceae bacterium]